MGANINPSVSGEGTEHLDLVFFDGGASIIGGPPPLNRDSLGLRKSGADKFALLDGDGGARTWVYCSDASHGKGCARFGAAARVASSDSKLLMIDTVCPSKGVLERVGHSDLFPVLGVRGAIITTFIMAHVQSEFGVLVVEVLLGEVVPRELNIVDGRAPLVGPLELLGVVLIDGGGRSRPELICVRKRGPVSALTGRAGAYATLEHGSLCEVEGCILEGTHVELAVSGVDSPAHVDFLENSQGILDLNIRGEVAPGVGGPRDHSITVAGFDRSSTSHRGDSHRHGKRVRLNVSTDVVGPQLEEEGTSIGQVINSVAVVGSCTNAGVGIGGTVALHDPVVGGRSAGRELFPGQTHGGAGHAFGLEVLDSGGGQENGGLGRTVDSEVVSPAAVLGHEGRYFNNDLITILEVEWLFREGPHGHDSRSALLVSFLAEHDANGLERSVAGPYLDTVHVEWRPLRFKGGPV
jgi:hypothetical protein